MIKKVHFKDWHFMQSLQSVIYYDPKGESEFSKYIASHLSEIKSCFYRNEKQFWYLPDVCKSITKEQIKYRYPKWSGELLYEVHNDALKKCLYDDTIGACFFLKVAYAEDEFYCYELEQFNKISLNDQIELFCTETAADERQYSANDVRFSISPNKPNTNIPVFEKQYTFADTAFDVNKISAELEQVISKLKKDGIEQFVLQCMVPVEEKLSKLLVTSNYEILLPDYENLSIEMTPLAKSVFLLFLKNTEGINFKDLVDYKEDLASIYLKITNRNSCGVIYDTIMRVVDPTQNTINENCSRIKEAFLKKIDESIAKNYYITGAKGENKKIILPRELVEWQCEI